ncbi:MAG: glycosyltransferase family 39 protein [Desulfobacteraceae bacterium]|nr:glycosyltransferase family 39 protein [Desulfobacteraceae bacterium]
MDEKTQRWLMSSVDAHGNPKWEPATLKDLSEDELEGIPDEVLVDLYADEMSPEEMEGDWLKEFRDRSAEGGKMDKRTKLINLSITVGIFLLAALPRLYVLFFVTDLDNPGVGWYNDTFHHWQIAYLSKEIGFSQGFLRLWDFKGMEYFWGLLHPLLLSVLFTLTGSIDILIPRLVSLIFGSASVVLLYYLLRRYFNLHVALAGVLLGTVIPVAVFADAAGLLQPIAMFLLLLGLLLWPRHPVWTGLSWALAGTVRAEYWVFGAGLFAVSIFAKEKAERKIALGAGWLIPSLVYMKYMIDHTGNPIYPVYWNFMGNVAGEWMGNRPLNTFQISLQWTGRIALIFVVVAAIWIIWKQQKSYLFILYGLGNILFVTLVFGFSAYIHGILPRILFARFMIVPYLFIGIFISILLLDKLPKLNFRRLWLIVGWIVILSLAVLTQLAWEPIMGYYEGPKDHWTAMKQMAEEIASLYDGGTVSIPEDRPLLTYALVRYQGFSAEQLQGQMYDPFFYFKDDDPFKNWSDNREVVADWLEKSDIQLIVFTTAKETYTKMISQEEKWFKYLASPYRNFYQAYQVVHPLSH